MINTEGETEEVQDPQKSNGFITVSLFVFYCVGILLMDFFILVADSLCSLVFSSLSNL